MNWQPDAAIEARLSVAAPTKSAEEWPQIKDYLVASFAAYLGLDIEPVWEPLDECVSPHWSSVSFGIKSRLPLGGPLRLEWYGVISHSSRGHTEALILLFSNDQRVIHHEYREYLYFEFFLAANGHWEWNERGWCSSEMNEWDGYLRLSQICEQKRQEQARGWNDA